MLKEFQSSIGRASDVIPKVDSNFEQACLWILIEAYKRMKKEKHYESTWNETRFSAHLIGHMRKIRDISDIALHIDPESHLYRQEILEGLENPDTASRIDIKIMGGWVKEDIYYGIEGKILVENDWRTRRSYNLRNRYIKTGIDNFVNGRYSHNISKGCIAGYVVQGSTPRIVSMINKLLTRKGRNIEKIGSPHTINYCSDCYQSKHLRKTDVNNIELYHIFLKFN